MGQSQIDKLIQSATSAYHQAYAPYSKFNVGAAILDEYGHIHHGCNVENAAYPSGSCAEEQAIGTMIVHGSRIIKEIVVIGISDQLLTPCGACRQRIREFSDSSTTVHVCHLTHGLQKSFKLDELLAYSFGPNNL